VALNDYARANDPFTKVGKQQVAVDVSSVIRASPDSFRVAWTERRYENGQLAETERWTAILTIVVQPPRDADGCGPIRSASTSTPSTGRRSLGNEAVFP
jgi:type IV secretion system protein VirB5